MIKQIVKWAVIIFVLWVVFWALASWFPQTFGATNDWAATRGFLGLHSVSLPYMSWFGAVMTPLQWLGFGLLGLLLVYALGYLIDADAAEAGMKEATEWASGLSESFSSGVGAVVGGVAGGALAGVPIWVWLVGAGVLAFVLLSNNKKESAS